MLDDGEFTDTIRDRLAGLPGVEAVTLGGSRAAGTARPDSDWDFAIYYRDRFSTADLRAVGWEGEVFEIGAWGGGVFNGGAWLSIDGRHVDVHYRDLRDVERRIAEAQQGRFEVEHLLFHLAGIPTYIVVAEMAVNRVLHGRLPPPPAYPAALRASASRRWWTDAQLTLGYARDAHLRGGHLTESLGAMATAAHQVAHAILAARGEWITNEKALLARAGLRDVDEILAGLDPVPGRLRRAIGELDDRLRSAAAAVGIGPDGAHAP